MKIGDIVIYARSSGMKALGKVGNIDGLTITLLNIVDDNLNELSGRYGTRNTTIHSNDIIDVIRL